MEPEVKRASLRAAPSCLLKTLTGPKLSKRLEEQFAGWPIGS